VELYLVTFPEMVYVADATDAVKFCPETLAPLTGTVRLGGPKE
jgi:hypothetical protein